MFTRSPCGFYSVHWQKLVSRKDLKSVRKENREKLVFNFHLGFHLSHRLTEKFPESCLLIILGLIVGGLLYITHLAEQKAYVLNSDTFFLFLLPVSKSNRFQALVDSLSILSSIVRCDKKKTCF